MDTTTLQIPVSKSLKADATIVAKEYGFSSLQEIVRVMLAKLAKKELSITISEQFPPVKLSAKNEARYAKMEEDFKTGKNVFYAKNVNEFLNDLAS